MNFRKVIKTIHGNNNTAFVIGNGLNANNKSDALVVKFNGDATLAGSMTATSFIGDGSQLTNLPSSGGDSPFSYNSNEAGGIEVADYTTASGTNSTAMGAGTIASGIFSTAMGANTEASGNRSTAMGHFTTASGAYSTAMGYETTASESWSIAMGHNTTASGIVSAYADIFPSMLQSKIKYVQINFRIENFNSSNDIWKWSTK